MSGILITGGSGAFGKAFVNHLLDNSDHDRICIYSRGEAKQAEMRDHFGDDERLRFFIGDIRNKDRLRVAMCGINDVIHAAALKRIETCFYNSSEVVQTNVIGTLNVIEAAAAESVDRVVTLSSDKAYKSISIYGHSKAMAESITLSANHTYGEYGPKYSAVRYGNIINSTLSVIPKWRNAILAGKEIYITDPDCTRFSMLQEEAVQLVLDTLEKMPPDKPAIPILSAYRVGDMAEAMGIKNPNIIGLPIFEKLHEGMEDGNYSNTARRLTIAELKEILKNV